MLYNNIDVINILVLISSPSLEIVILILDMPKVRKEEIKLKNVFLKKELIVWKNEISTNKTIRLVFCRMWKITQILFAILPYKIKFKINFYRCYSPQIYTYND